MIRQRWHTVRLTRLLISVLLLLGVNGAVMAAGSGTISGTVHLQGSPAAGIRLVVMHDSISSYTGSTSTDGTGTFSVTSVPLGNIIIRVYDANDQHVGEQAATLTTPDAIVDVVISIN